MDWSSNPSITTENFLKSLEKQDYQGFVETYAKAPDPPVEFYDGPQCTPEEAYDMGIDMGAIVPEPELAAVDEPFSQASHTAVLVDLEESAMAERLHSSSESEDTSGSVPSTEGHYQRETRRVRWCSVCRDRVQKPHQCFSSVVSNSSEEH